MYLITKKMPYTVNNAVKYVVEVRCDSIGEITPPDPSWYMGSLVLALTEQKIYGLTSAGEWVEQTAESL